MTFVSSQAKVRHVRTRPSVHWGCAGPADGNKLYRYSFDLVLTPAFIRHATTTLEYFFFGLKHSDSRSCR